MSKLLTPVIPRRFLVIDHALHAICLQCTAPLRLHLLIMKSHGNGEPLRAADLRQAAPEGVHVVAAGCTSQYGMVELEFSAPEGGSARQPAFVEMTRYLLTLEAIGEADRYADGVTVAYASVHWKGSEVLDVLIPQSQSGPDDFEAALGRQEDAQEEAQGIWRQILRGEG